ncbi:RHS repeat protein, partial [bacterium]|nr:RHS repeat protein [bacterium]
GGGSGSSGGTGDEYNKDIQFSAPMSTGITIAASNSIRLSTGYSFSAETGGNLKLWIDKTVSVSPPNISGGSSNAESEYMHLVTNRTTGAPATQSYIDALGREVRSGSMRFDGNYLYADKEYDSYGRLSRISLPFKGSLPSLWNTYTYDDYDRPLSITYASGKTDNFSYSGLSATSTIDGITKTITKDATGKVVNVVDPAGTITYNIRPDGQPSSIVAPGNITTTFEYDDYGRQKKLIDPSAGTRTYTYDDAQSIISETDDRGKITKTTSDKYNRVMQKEIVGELTTNYTYNSDGQIDTIRSNNSTAKIFTYDGLMRLSTVKDKVPDGKYLQKDFSYSAGIPLAVSFSTQNGTFATENYSYTYGTKTEIKLNNSSSVWKLTSENDMGLATGAITGNLTRDYGYDMYGLPTLRVVKSGASTIQDFETN